MSRELVAGGQRSYVSWYIVVATAKHRFRARLQRKVHRFATEVNGVVVESCGSNELEERWLWP